MTFISNSSVAAGQDVNQTIASEINPVVLQIYNIYLYVMIVLGVSGNFVVIVMFSKLPPNTTTDWFIFFITTCDFITSFINVPIYVTFTNGVWKYFGNNIICSFQMFLSQSLVWSSAFLICGLAMDRYFKICKPMTYFPKTRARNVCLLISLLTTLFSVPSFVLFENRDGGCRSVVRGYGLFAYYLFVFLTFLLATVVVVFSYTHVTRRVSESRQTIERYNRSKQISRDKKVKIFRRVNQVVPYSADKPGKDRLVSECSDGNAEEVDRQSIKTISGKTIQANEVSTQGPSKEIAHGTLIPSKSLSTSANDLETKTRFFNESNEVITRRTSVSQGQTLTRGQLVTLRTTKIAFLVCTIFIVTWIPPWASFILSVIPGMKANPTVVSFIMFGRMTYLINTMTNPILYTWLNRKFRRNFMRIFLCRKI